MRMSSPSNEAAPRLKMDDLEDLLAQHASVTMNLGLKDHSVSRRDALLGQSMIEKDRAEARDFTRRGDGVAPELLRPQDLPPAQEVHSELMEAVMQQWLHTAAGQAAAQEAARLDLGADEIGQFFHARMLQSLGRLRADDGPEMHPDHMHLAHGQLPHDDESAVERLCALGFARASAIEAYLACNRDEMLAANYLVDQ